MVNQRKIALVIADDVDMSLPPVLSDRPDAVRKEY